jgi:hypothetical protein
VHHHNIKWVVFWWLTVPLHGSWDRRIGCLRVWNGLVAAFDLSLTSNLPFYNRLSALSPLEEVRQAATAGWERFNTGLPLAISLHCQ